LVGATGFEPVTSSVSANTGNRCARRRSPRSAPTVDAEGKRSVDVQGNALFGHSTLPLLHVCCSPPALTRHCRRPSTASTVPTASPATGRMPPRSMAPRHPLQRRRRGDPSGPGQGTWDPGRWMWATAGSSSPSRRPSSPSIRRTQAAGRFVPAVRRHAATVALRLRDRAWPLSAQRRGV
jgi:hypothetical protein